MALIKDGLMLVIYITGLIRKLNPKQVYQIFFNYILTKKNQFFKMDLKLHCIPDETFSYLVMKYGKCNECYVDSNLYILCNLKSIDRMKTWFYLCGKISMKGYKVAVIFIDSIAENNLYVSETMKFNVNKCLHMENLNDPSYFLVAANEISTNIAEETKISLISHPYKCPDSLLNNILQNFFSTPKYLRTNDIFRIYIKKNMPKIKYCINDTKLDVLYFKVNNIKSKKQGNGSFVVYGETTLIQEVNVNSYLPQKCMCNITFNLEKQFSNIWPMALNEPLCQLQRCIVPFLQKDFCLNVKPVFLVEGPNGAGKARLIKTAAETLGLHFVEADFGEVQSLTSAQTEAKLKIILHDAEDCVPCILMLENIQIFGINPEGQKDERIIAALSTEIKKLYSKKLKYQIILIATTTDSEIPIDSEKTFVEKITIGQMEQEQRCDVLSWIIKNRGLNHQIDLQKISKMCSDFVLADFEALVSHAVKYHFKEDGNDSKNNCFTQLTNEDFIYACEYMQSIFSDQIGAPKVPKVYWDDIGGLADLKCEIMRRIEMPLLNIPGMSRSGLLLYGPPGTGKTLLAKAVATECQLHFLAVKGPELLNMYVGQSEKNVRQVFERARAAAPCIIFFDELDSLAPNRGQSGDSGGVMDRVVSQLLAEMDGLESTGNIFIIAATNRPDLIDSALLRPGRFDKMLYVGIYSDSNSQISVMRALTKKFRMEKDGEELKEVIKILPMNLTGADLYSVCSNAWLHAVRRTLMELEGEREKVKGEDVVVKLEDFVMSGKELVTSVSKEEMIRYERLREELSAK